MKALNIFFLIFNNALLAYSFIGFTTMLMSFFNTCNIYRSHSSQQLYYPMNAHPKKEDIVQVSYFFRGIDFNIFNLHIKIIFTFYMYMSTSWDTVYAIPFPCQSCPSRKIIKIGYTELVSKKNISFKESGSHAVCWRRYANKQATDAEHSYIKLVANRTLLGRGLVQTLIEKK